MAYRVNDSIDTHPDELNIFLTPPTEAVYEKVQWIEHRPVSQFKEGNPLEFIIPGSGTQYINLKQSLLHIKVRVLKADGSPPGNDHAALINLPLHTLWSQVDVSLQQKLISPATNNYCYKALLETVLSYDKGAKESQLQAAGYYKDTANTIEASQPITGGNAGLSARYGLTKDEATADFIGPLHADICQQNRLLLNGVEVQIKLWPANSQFCLMSASDTAEFKVDIVDALIKVCKVTVNPSVTLAHSKILETTPAKYPYERSEIKTYTIPAGNFSFKAENLFQGAIPSRMVIAFVKTAAYTGDYTLNPFNFVHANLNSLAVYLNDESIPAKPLRPDFTTLNYVSCYYSLFTGLDKDGKDLGNGISREDYDNGYTLFVYELQPGAGSDHFPLIKRGVLNVEASFAQALNQNLTAIVMAKFPDMIQIDNTRNVLK